jgi:hypothetical protein
MLAAPGPVRLRRRLGPSGWSSVASGKMSAARGARVHRDHLLTFRGDPPARVVGGSA